MNKDGAHINIFGTLEEKNSVRSFALNLEL